MSPLKVEKLPCILDHKTEDTHFLGGIWGTGYFL